MTIPYLKIDSAGQYSAKLRKTPHLVLGRPRPPPVAKMVPLPRVGWWAGVTAPRGPVRAPPSLRSAISIDCSKWKKEKKIKKTIELKQKRIPTFVYTKRG